MPAFQINRILAQKGNTDGIWSLTFLSLIACLVFVGFSILVIVMQANPNLNLYNPYQLHPATLCVAVLVLINIPLSYYQIPWLTRNLLVWGVWVCIAVVVWFRLDGHQIFRYQWVNILIGDPAEARHFSLPSAFLLWMLATVQVTNLGRRLTGIRRWVSFCAICMVLFVSFGQLLLEIDSHGTDYFYGLSLSSAFIIGLMAIVMAQFSLAKTVFFDPETPIANRISIAAILFGMLGIVIGRMQGWDIWLLWLGVFGFTMTVVVVLDQGVRTLERAAIHGNTEDNRIHFAVFDQASGRDAFEKLQLSHARAYYIHFLVVFASTICAVYLARLYTEPVASLWWANGLIAVALASFVPLNSFGIILVSICAMCLGNMTVGNAFGTSLFFSVLNTTEAVMVSFLYRRYILPKPTILIQPRPFEAVFLSIKFLGGLVLITCLTAGVASQYIHRSFVQAVSVSYFEWFFGAVLGHIAVALLTYELLRSGGTIRHPKHKEFLGEWTFRIGISVAAVILVFAAGVEINYVQEISGILLVMVFLAPLLHTNMTDIGVTFGLMVLVLYLGGLHPLLRPENLNFVVLYAFSGGFLFSLNILKESLIGRFHDQENVMQTAPSLLVTLDKNARVTSISNRMADLLGRPIGNSLGLTLPKLGFQTLSDTGFFLDNTFFNNTGSDEHRFEAVLHTDNAEPIYLLGHLVINSDEDLSFDAVVQFTEIQEIEKSRQQASFILNNSGSFLITHTKDGVILNASKEWFAASGFIASEVIGSNMRDFFGIEDTQGNSFDLSAENTQNGENILTGQKKSGEFMILQRKKIILIDAEQDVYLTALQDITELKREIILNENLLNRSAAVILSQDADLKIRSCSDAWIAQFGYSREETIGADILDFMNEESAKNSLALRTSQDLRTEVFSKYISTKRTLVTKSGEERLVELKISTDVKDDIFTRTIVILDITDAMKERLDWDDLAHRDKATNLLNGRGLLRNYDQEQEHMYAFVRLNLPHRFRRGFEGSVEIDILGSLSEILQSLVPVDGMVGRISDQDFVVICPWNSWQIAQDFAQKVGHGFSTMRFIFHGVKHDCKFGIGLARSGSGMPFTEALRLSEVAANDALTEKKNSIVKVDKAFLARHDEKGTFISDQDVANAFLDGEITYSLRPVIDKKENKIFAFDARLIWQRDDGKYIDPELFLPQFIRVQNRPDVFAAWDHLISKVFDHLAEFSGCRISTNIPAHDLNFDGAAQRFNQRLKGLIGSKSIKIMVNIGSDLGENFIDQDALKRQLMFLKMHGYSVALSENDLDRLRIESLLKYPIDTLRIGGALIKAAESDQKSYDMLQALVQSFQAQGLTVIATDVKTPSQSALLTDIGIHLQQGLFYTRFDPRRPVLSDLHVMSETHHELVHSKSLSAKH